MHFDSISNLYRLDLWCHIDLANLCHRMWFGLFPTSSISDCAPLAPYARSGGALAQIYLGYFPAARFPGILICITGERYEKGNATSRGALQKRQLSVKRKRQQASSPHVKDWLKREEILSLSNRQPSNSNYSTVMQVRWSFCFGP
jgi:hypothetical protein